MNRILNPDIGTVKESAGSKLTSSWSLPFEMFENGGDDGIEESGIGSLIGAGSDVADDSVLQLGSFVSCDEDVDSAIVADSAQIKRAPLTEEIGSDCDIEGFAA